MSCPEQWWESVLEERLDGVNCDPAHPHPPLLLLLSLNHKPQAARLIFFTLIKSVPREALCLCSEASTLLLLHFELSLANLGDNSQVLVQICSSSELWDLHGLFRFCPHPYGWD